MSQMICFWKAGWLIKSHNCKCSLKLKMYYELTCCSGEFDVMFKWSSEKVKYRRTMILGMPSETSSIPLPSCLSSLHPIATCHTFMSTNQLLQAPLLPSSVNQNELISSIRLINPPLTFCLATNIWFLTSVPDSIVVMLSKSLVLVLWTMDSSTSITLILRYADDR